MTTLDSVILTCTVTASTVNSSSTFLLQLMYTAILARPTTKFKSWHLCFGWRVFKRLVAKQIPYTLKKQLLEIKAMLTDTGIHKNNKRNGLPVVTERTLVFHWRLTQKSWMERCHRGLSSGGLHVSWRVEACTAPSTRACSLQLGPRSFSRACQLFGSVFLYWFSSPASCKMFLLFRRRLVKKHNAHLFSRGPERSLKSGARKIAGTLSSSATMLVDDVRSRRSWLESLDFQWSSSFCTILREFSPNWAARPEESSIWGPVWPSVTCPAVTILPCPAGKVQLGPP